MHAVEIFDYDAFYLPHINDKLAYHSIPHQFKFQKHGSDVLCHYKMWSVDAEWLPCQVVNSLNDTAIPSPIVVAVNDGAKEIKKKRKFTRGAAKPHLKRKKTSKAKALSVNLEDSSSDESHEPPHILYTEEFCHEALPTRGILWLTSLPPVESSPTRVSIPDDEKQQKLKCVNILWKHAPQQTQLYLQHCTLQLQTGKNGKATRFVCGREQTNFYKQFKSLHGFHLSGHVVRPVKMTHLWLKAQRFTNLYQARRL